MSPANRPPAVPSATGSNGAAASQGGRGGLLAQVRAAGRTSPVRAPSTAAARAGAHADTAEAAAARAAAEAPAPARTPKASAAPALQTPKNTPRAPVALAITGRRRGSGSRTPRQVLADALQVRSAKKGFSGALLRLVSDVVQGQKLRKGARVWLDRGGGAFAAGELLSAPQKESGRLSLIHI